MADWKEALGRIVGCELDRQDAATIRAHIEGLEARNAEVEIACAQAVEFAQYVESAAKGAMVEHAQRYLSLPYSQGLAERLSRAEAAEARVRELEAAPAVRLYVAEEYFEVIPIHGDAYIKLSKMDGRYFRMVDMDTAMQASREGR